MNIPKEIVEKAIEGGWNPSRSATMSMQEAVERLRYEEIALDPTFWQALGKALGWGTSCWHYSEYGLYEVYRHEAVCDLSSARSQSEIQAQRFYHCVYQGKDTTAFWQELTTN